MVYYNICIPSQTVQSYLHPITSRRYDILSIRRGYAYGCFVTYHPLQRLLEKFRTLFHWLPDIRRLLQSFHRSSRSVQWEFYRYCPDLSDFTPEDCGPATVHGSNRRIFISVEHPPPDLGLSQDQ